MKKRTYLLWLFAAVLLAACSTSDDSQTTDDQSGDGNNDGNGDPVEVIDYFPLNADSWWTYNNTSDQGASRDSLYVTGTTVIDGETFTNMDALEPAVAFMTNLFSQSAARTTDTELILNGELTSPVIDGFPTVIIPLENVALYDSSANTGDILATVTGELNEVISTIPVLIDYTVVSEQGEKLASFTLEGQNFEDVLTSKIIVNLAVTAQIEIGGIVIPFPILLSQDVLVITNYYVKDTGLVFSDVQFEYMLEDLSGTGIDPGIPTEGSSTSAQTIDSFFIGN